MKQKIALAGTPNCGKTTFWNLATGRRGKTGNWPGVTIEKLSAPLKIFPDTELIDLPGTYSLSAKSLEEATAENFLKNDRADALIIIIDGTKPEQGLYLALELLVLGIPSVIGINFADELRAQNIIIDTDNLQKHLGAPVFLISAKKNENINALLSAAKDITGTAAAPIPVLSLKERRKKAALLSEKYFSAAEKEYASKSRFAVSVLPVLMVFFFLLAFPDEMLKNGIRSFFEHAAALFAALMNYFRLPSVLKGLVSDGILPGVSSAVSFIPQLSIVFFTLAFLENSGHMARFAFSCDFILKKIGLSGRSMMPLLLGFSCTVPAVYAAKSSDSEASRSRTLSMLMFVPCSARLPLILLICEEVFKNSSVSIVLLFYFIVISIGSFFSFIQNRGKSSGFILELPQIRVPSAKSIIKTTWRSISSFISKAFGMIVLTSVLIWVLKNFSIRLEPAELQSETALAFIGGFLAPVFAPIGIPYEGAVALFCGLFAKESALFALVSISDNIGSLFDTVSAVSFLLFYMIYSPCLACLFAIENEFGIKKAILLFLRQTALAYFISFIFFQFALLIQNIFSL